MDPKQVFYFIVSKIYLQKTEGFRVLKEFERVLHQYFEGVYLSYSNNVAVVDGNDFFLYENIIFLGTYLIENSFKVGKTFDKIT
jgi:hypothetical protein